MDEDFRVRLWEMAQRAEEARQALELAKLVGDMAEETPARTSQTTAADQLACKVTGGGHSE